MENLNVSVGLLEQFRRYQEDTTDQDTEAKLIARVKGKQKIDAKRQIVAGWKHMLLHPGLLYRTFPYKSRKWVSANDIYYPHEEAKKALAYIEAHSKLVPCQPIRKMYTVGGMQIQVTGSLYGIEGMQLREVKLNYGQTDILAYMASYQWRFLLDMMHSKVLYYDVFEVATATLDEYMPPHGSAVEDLQQRMVGGYKLKTGEDGRTYLYGFEVTLQEPIACASYEAMQMDLIYLLTDFRDWVTYRQLGSYLKIKSCPGCGLTALDCSCF